MNVFRCLVVVLAAILCVFSVNTYAYEESYSDEGPFELEIGLTNVYQANVNGGLSTNDRTGRYVGRYDVELTADMESLFGLDGGAVFVHGWGGWPDTEGIDGHSVGSAWGINALSVGNRSMDIVELFYEAPFINDGLILSFGKMDFTGIFDASEYADDEVGQFLNASLVDDPTIPFPEQGLGITLNWNITDSWYLLGGIADAQADARETGFRTAFHKEDYLFWAVETGKTIEIDSCNGALPGTYRVGMWVDDQDKERISNGENKRDDIGFYTSCDQMLIKENDDPEDTQGLGAFFRYGWADSEYNTVTNFFSVGIQSQGLFECRDDDVLGIGYSQGFFSDKDSDNFASDYESVLEAYYNFQLRENVVIGPNVQYIAGLTDGEGAKTSDAVVVGMRLGISF